MTTLPTDVRVAPAAAAPPRRWSALAAVCLGVLMIMLDTTALNVALSSIRSGLGFSEDLLVWVVNAYLLTLGGCLVLGGRLVDTLGGRPMFLGGSVLFTAASLACGLAGEPWILILARAAQGIGAAVVLATGLALVTQLFSEGHERARAMGIYSFVSVGGSSIGLVLGGLLTSAFGWRWIFLINIPIGIAVYLLGRQALPSTKVEPDRGSRVDLGGAALMTTSAMLILYAVINANAAGWRSAETLAVLTLGSVLLSGFLVLESRVRNPLIPLRMFRLPSFSVATALCVLWAGSMWACFFLLALYMQRGLGYAPLSVGLAFLPATIASAVLSATVSATLVTRFGKGAVIAAGMSLEALGLLWLARAPVQGDFAVDLLPPMLLLGVGEGIAFNALLLAGTSGVAAGEIGVASGINATARTLGGALGLAAFASLAQSHSDALIRSGTGTAIAVTEGYGLAFLGAAACVACAAVIAAGALRQRVSQAPPSADGSAVALRRH